MLSEAGFFLVGRGVFFEVGNGMGFVGFLLGIGEEKALAGESVASGV